MEEIIFKYLEHRSKAWIQVHGMNGLSFNKMMKELGVFILIPIAVGYLTAIRLNMKNC